MHEIHFHLLIRFAVHKVTAIVPDHTVLADQPTIFIVLKKKKTKQSAN